MDYETYRRSYFTDPRPAPQFEFTGTFGVTLYYEEFEQAVDYYSRVLGPPAYVEGEGTLGWAIGPAPGRLHFGRRRRPGTDGHLDVRAGALLPCPGPLWHRSTHHQPDLAQATTPSRKPCALAGLTAR